MNGYPRFTTVLCAAPLQGLDRLFEGHPTLLLYTVMVCCPLLMNLCQVLAALPLWLLPPWNARCRAGPDWQLCALLLLPYCTGGHIKALVPWPWVLPSAQCLAPPPAAPAARAAAAQQQINIFAALPFYGVCFHCSITTQLLNCRRSYKTWR